MASQRAFFGDAAPLVLLVAVLAAMGRPPLHALGEAVSRSANRCHHHAANRKGKSWTNRHFSTH
jgi:hypothetical protein